MRRCGVSGQIGNALGLITVRSLADLPVALGRLAHLVAVAEHLQPATVGRLAADQARTLVTQAGVVERRDSVVGTTAPALLGAAGELRGHALALVDVRAETRQWRSNGRDDSRPSRQMKEIRRQLDRNSLRIHRALTDGDLRTVIGALRPALLLAPALHHTVSRHLHSEAWDVAPVARDGLSNQARMLAATQAARESAARLSMWLPAAPRRLGGRTRTAIDIDHASWGLTK
jgi:hypothetical protein